MVSDGRDRARFLVCPDKGEDDATPLIRQQITEATCAARQRRGYYKCHACRHRDDEIWAPKVESMRVY